MGSAVLDQIFLASSCWHAVVDSCPVVDHKCRCARLCWHHMTAYDKAVGPQVLHISLPSSFIFVYKRAIEHSILQQPFQYSIVDVASRICQKRKSKGKIESRSQYVSMETKAILVRPYRISRLLHPLQGIPRQAKNLHRGSHAKSKAESLRSF